MKTSTDGFRASPIHFAITLGVLAFGVIPLPRALSTVKAVRESMKSVELNRLDREAGAGGYYEGLIDGAEGPKGTRSELSRRLLGKPVEWNRFQAADVSHPIPTDYLQFELRPDLDRPLFGSRFTTNSHGMRDRETTVAKPERTFRIALLGSSIDMGWGVDTGETYENQLEDWLNARARLKGIDRRYEVLNFAVAAYGPTQRYGVFKRKAQTFAPDLVIYSATLLDARLLELHLSGLITKQIDPTYPFLKERIADAGLSFVTDATLDSDGRPLLRSQGKQKIRTQFWPIVDATLGALAGDCRSMNIPLLVIAVPRAGKADTPQARTGSLARLAGITARHAIPFLDLTPEFDRFDSAQIEIAPWDDHPNAFGHRRLFLGLARAILKQPECTEALFATSPSSTLEQPIAP